LTSTQRLFADATKIDAAGLSLNLLCQQYADQDLRALIEGGTNVRCLFLPPYGTSIASREREEGYPAGHLSALTEMNRQILLQRVRERLTEDAGLVCRSPPTTRRSASTCCSSTMSGASFSPTSRRRGVVLAPPPGRRQRAVLCPLYLGYGDRWGVATCFIGSGREVGERSVGRVTGIESEGGGVRSLEPLDE
jgi:Domain of unknown function (DUF5919)